MAQAKVKADVPIEALLKEKRKFPPPAAFVKNAVMNRKTIYAEAQRNLVKFWEGRARELHWFKPWKKALEWKPPYAKWFVGGKLNVAYNCLDRHVTGPRKTKAALIWEGEPGDSRVLTYWDLYREVNRFAAALKRHGVRKGDRVTIYMPMVPELPIAMLACARIGAAHSVIFGGFSPEAVRERIHDAESTLVITADGGYRRGGMVPLKKNTDEALRGAPGVKTVIVLKRTGQPVEMQSGRDVWWDDFVKDVPARCPAEPMDSEDLLYLLYTSGSTGKPKGIIHTTGGYLTGVSATHKWIFDLQRRRRLLVHRRHRLGHRPLLHRLWTARERRHHRHVRGHARLSRTRTGSGAIVEKYGVTICYTAPTAIRTFMKWGEEYPKRCDLSSLRLLGTVGEPINPEAWMWYWKVIGGGRCPIVDTWWQTETGHILITPLPGLTALKPGSATLPFPGVDAEVLDEKGNPAKSGYLVLRKPWPGMLRGIWGDPDRFVKQYWSKYDNIYFTGDGAKRDEDGYFWLLGPRRRRHERLGSPRVHDGGRIARWSITSRWPRRRSSARRTTSRGRRSPRSSR